MHGRAFCILLVGSVAGFAHAHGASALQLSSRSAAPVEDTTPPASSGKKVAYIKASNPRSDAQFGYSLSISRDGKTLAVGAVNESSGAKGFNGNQHDDSAPASGAVYIFTRNGDDWVQQAYIKASNADAHDQFGYSLALSGDGNTLAVGANLEDSSAKGINGNQADNTMTNSGAVYVFTRRGTNWSQQAYVKASNTGSPDEGDQFGYSVALSDDGSTLAVGAIAESSAASGVNAEPGDRSLEDAGAVYVFTRTGSAWSQMAYVKSSHPAEEGMFGFSIALNGSGDTLAITAAREDTGKGAIYLFGRQNNTWMQQARLQGSNPERGAPLSSIVLSTDGNTLAAGAFDEHSLATGVNGDYTKATKDAAVGAVYVFSRNSTAWSQQVYVKPSNSRKNEQFGWAVALSGDGNTLAVGARIEDSAAKGLNGDQSDRSAPDAGAAYVFARAGGTWSQKTYVKALNTGSYEEFGIAVATSGDGSVLAVGAHLEPSSAPGINGNQNDRSAPNAGAVYVYY